MQANLKACSQKTAPITVHEFFEAIRRLWRQDPQQGLSHVGGEKRLGLAVSGGVDSMAMAMLCAKLRDHQGELPGERSEIDFKFHAFIVNHRIRKESGEEAVAVLKQLRKFDIPTKILPIRWPRRLNLSKLSNLESLARMHRYQLLGRACRKERIETLLMAHHQDDQAETVFMRLMNGHRGLGLTGIKPIADIPECFGIHGVNRSGLLDTLDSAPDESTTPKSAREQLECEDGGIKIYRPLLDFSKERLRATCLENGVSWFEDVTNADPTLTTRNAIRHMYSTSTFPLALQKPRLLALSKVLRTRFDNLSRDSLDDFHKKVKIMNFEPRVGSVLVCFTGSPGTPDEEIGRERYKHSQRQSALLWLQNLIECVSPEEHASLSNLSVAQQQIFPQLNGMALPSVPGHAFTVAGASFQRVDSKGRFITGARNSELEKNLWYLSRQLAPEVPGGQEEYLQFPARYGSDVPPEWLLYDGRYWLQIINHTHNLLHIRPYRKVDSTALEERLDDQSKKDLKFLLKKLAPAKVRWTLPAIVMTEQSGIERVIALPTLGVHVKNISHLLHYGVRYKKVPSWLKSVGSTP